MLYIASEMFQYFILRQKCQDSSGIGISLLMSTVAALPCLQRLPPEFQSRRDVPPTVGVRLRGRGGARGRLPELPGGVLLASSAALVSTSARS